MHRRRIFQYATKGNKHEITRSKHKQHMVHALARVAGFSCNQGLKETYVIIEFRKLYSMQSESMSVHLMC